MSNKQYTIIVTTYNASAFIPLFLERMSQLVGEDGEVVIVDDGSTDDTVANIRATDLEFVTLIEAGKVGRSRALNIAVDHSSGDLLLINDIDDLSTDQRLYSALEMHKDGIDVCFGVGIEVEDLSSQKLDKFHELLCSQNEEIDVIDIRKISAIDLFRTNPLHHSTMSIRKTALLSVGGYDESLSVCVDLDLYYRLLVENFKLYFCRKNFILRNVGVTRQFSKVKKKQYYSTLLKLRMKYRAKLSIPSWLYLYDCKFFLRKVFS